MFNLPADAVSAYIAGQTLAFFSNATAYATASGAIDCSARAASQFRSPADGARACGPLFVNPDAVTGGAFDYQQVADGSFAGREAKRQLNRRAVSSKRCALPILTQHVRSQL